jgi:hypothetical protein
MADDRRAKVSKEEADGLLTQLKEAVPRQDCWSCECLRGFVAQLELDATEQARALLARHEANPSQVHGCLGCEPCAPAEIFAEYLLRNRKR